MLSRFFFYCFCFRKWIPEVLKCADCLMGLVDLCCRKRVQRACLRFRFYMSCSRCNNGFLFSQIPLSWGYWLLCSYGNFMENLSCDYSWNVRKILYNDVALIRMKCRLCNFTCIFLLQGTSMSLSHKI